MATPLVYRSIRKKIFGYSFQRYYTVQVKGRRDHFEKNSDQKTLQNGMYMSIFHDFSTKRGQSYDKSSFFVFVLFQTSNYVKNACVIQKQLSLHQNDKIHYIGIL